MIHKNTHIINITHVLTDVIYIKHIIYITHMVKLIFKAYKKIDKFMFSSDCFFSPPHPVLTRFGLL